MDDDDAEIERELERELAALNSLSDFSVDLPHPALTDTGSDTEDIASEEESESFRAFVNVLQKRDAQLSGFQQELEAIAQQISKPEEANNETKELIAELHAAATHVKEPVHGGDSSEDVHGLDDLLAKVHVNTAIASLQQQVSASRPSTAIPGAGGPVNAAEEQAGQAREAENVSEVHDTYSAIASERTAAHAEYKAMEEARAAAVEQARRDRQEQEVQLRAEAEARTAAAAAELMRQQQEAEAAAVAAQQAIEKERAAAKAAAAAELAQMESERAERQARLAEQAAAQAALEEEMQRLQRELDLQRADAAWRELAARRIARAWRAYAVSPARSQRSQCVTKIQALWRGRAARRECAQLREQQDVLKRLDEAMSQGLMEAVQEAEQRASSLGLGREVTSKVAEFHASAREAAERLTAAATRGSALTFGPAVEAALKFPHLAPAVEAARSEFARRRAAAETGARAALVDRPMQDVKRALEEAATLGLDAAAIAAALEAARKRDADMAAALQQVASAAVFDQAAFDQLASKAVSVGLKGDVAAAKHILDKRRRLAARDIAQKSAGADVATLRGLMKEAESLGMMHEAKQLAAKMSSQREQAAAALEAAAKSGSTDMFEVLTEQAEQLGLEPEFIELARRQLADRRTAAAMELRHQALTGSLAAFKMARRVALACGGLDTLESSERAFENRRMAAARALTSTFTAVGTALHGHPSLAVHVAGAMCQGCGMSAASVLGVDPGAQEGHNSPASPFPAAPTSPRSARMQRHPVRCAAAAERLPHELPPAVAGLLSTMPGASTARVATQAAWEAVVGALRLGLDSNTRLALASLQLHGRVHSAESARVTGDSGAVQVDYWGNQQLPSWQQAAQQEQQAPGACVAWEQQAQQASMLQADQQVMLWPVPTSLAVQQAQNRAVNAPPVLLPPTTVTGARAGGAGDLPHRRPDAVQRGPAGPKHKHSAGTEGVALTPSMLSHMSPPGVPLTHLTRLDLGLERLTSLGHVGEWCPGLLALSANANRITTLAPLSALSDLQDLSVKDNLLSTLQGLGNKPALVKLCVDTNELTSLEGLVGAPRLEVLSANDNHLTSLLCAPSSLDPAQQPSSHVSALASCAATLTSLHVSSNALAGLHGLGVCASLTFLDVSRNQLDSLEGLQGCRALHHLNATANRLTAWPGAQLSGMAQLRVVELAGNAIQSLGGAGFPLSSGQDACTDLLVLPPALEVLVLQDNQVVYVAPLHGAPRLRELDLSFNALADPRPLHAALAPLQGLTALKVHDNPVAHHEEYLPTILAAAPGLRELDNQPLDQATTAMHMARAVGQSPLLALAAGTMLRSQQLHCVAGAVQAACYETCGAPTSAPVPASAPTPAGHAGEAAVIQLRCLVSALAAGPGCSQAAGGHFVECVEEEWAAQGLARATAVQGEQRQAASLLRPPGSVLGSSSAFGVPDMPDRHRWAHADSFDAPATRPMRKLAKQLLQGVKFTAGAGVGPGSGASAGAGGEAPNASPGYAQQYEQAMSALHAYHAAQVAAAAATGTCWDAPERLPEEEVITRASFFERRQQQWAAAASRIQAAWRGTKTRRHVAEIKSDAYQQRAAQAAASIQAVWRGHRVRTDPVLAAARRQRAAQLEAQRLMADQARRAAEEQAAREREGAAVILQAAIRAYGVRKRLKAVQQAARYEDDDELEGVDDDFLADVELMLRQEQIAPAPPAPAPLPTFGHHHNAQQQQQQGGKGVAAGAHTASPPQAPPAPPALPFPVNPQLLHQLPALSRAFAAKMGTMAAAAANGGGPPGVGAAAAAAGGSGGVAGGDGLPSAPLQHQHLATFSNGHPSSHLPPASTTQAALPPLRKQPWQQLPPMASPPPPAMQAQRPPPVSVEASNASVGGQGGGYGSYGGGYDEALSPQSQSQPASQYAGSQYAGSITSPNSDAAAMAEKATRHRERLEKLMAEWGFQDMATAEAYLRRQQRVTRGNARRQLEAKFRNPDARLKKLKEVVVQRAPLRPEDVMRQRPHGQEVALNQGALQGPPSRPSGQDSTSPGAPQSSGPRGVAPAQRQVVSADAVQQLSDGASGFLGSGYPGLPHQRSNSFSGLNGVQPTAHHLTDPAGRGAGPLHLPAVARRATSLSDMAGPTHPAPSPHARAAGGAASRNHYGRQSHVFDDDGQSVSSMASAVSEPVAGQGGAAAAALRKSSSLAGRGLRPSPTKSSAPPLVLPHLARPAMSNNWVLSPSATPPGHSGGAGGGPLEIHASPALAAGRKLVMPAGSSGGSTPIKGHLPPRGR